MPRKTLAQFLDEQLYVVNGDMVLNIDWKWVPEKTVAPDEVAYFSTRAQAIAQLKLLKMNEPGVKFKTF